MNRVDEDVYRRAKELLDYDPETGLFRWRERRSGPGKKGWFAGCKSSTGHCQIKVDGRTLKAHRIAYYIIYGELPPGIDHINEIKTDNRIANLRSATRSQNKANISRVCTNTSGVRGVSWHEQSQKWRAQIKVDGKVQYLGLFDCIHKGAQARRDAELEYYGEFAPKTSVYYDKQGGAQ